MLDFLYKLLCFMPFNGGETYFHKKTTPKLLEHIGLQNMKVGVKTNFGRLATIFQICSMDADILS